MSNSARDAYIATIDPTFAPAVLALDSAIMAAQPDFDTRIYYKMFAYALNGDFRNFVCAIDFSKPGKGKKPIHLRFLYGVLLDDPRGVLRAGTSILKTIDFVSVEDIDAQLVTDYVTHAFSKLDEFKAR